MMMECKGCGIALEKSDACMVAHWAFCKTCFESLMSKKDVAEPEPESASLECTLCHKEMTENEGKTMLGMLFCKTCHHSLTHRAEQPEPVVEEPEAPAFVVPQVEVNHRETIPCDGCGRIIPKSGTKVRVDGARLCPDCFYGEIH